MSARDDRFVLTKEELGAISAHASARALTENVKSLALMDVYGRIARLLLGLAVEREGKLVITERLT